MRLIAAAPLFLFALVGCNRMGGAAAHYKPIQVGRETENPPPILDGQDLEIRRDGTFLMRVFPKLEGRVERQGDLLILKIEKAGDRPLAEASGEGDKPVQLPPLRLQSVDGGARLRPDSSNQNPVKFTWLRSQR